MIQVIFNGKKSYNDLKIETEFVDIQPPSKKKIKDSVPFMHGSYDFSTVGSSGEQVYNERIIRAKFNITKSTSRATLYNKYSEVLEWLLEAGKSQLIFTDMPDCFYFAEVENAPSFEEVLRKYGRMEVEFIAEPFKYGVDYEGEKLWDTFNFETDYLQDTEFDVVGSKTVTIYNPGRVVVPTINVNSTMAATLNGYTTNLTSGNNKDWKFKLQTGINNITINGTGHIKFIFRKEML
jgi:predicted phage tail component-like protein